MKLLLLGCVVLGLGACKNDDPCPYAATAATCQDAAERTRGDRGLCAGMATSVLELTRDCQDWDPTFVACWVACVNAASTCEEAIACNTGPEDGGCYCCGRDPDYPGC